MRVGINGFGRIGRAYLRLAMQTPGLEVVAVNDLAESTENLAYSLRTDSIRGAYPGHVTASRGSMLVDDVSIRIFSASTPTEIPWHEAGVDLVIESTGAYRTRPAAAPHITHGGAKKVILSAYTESPDALLVCGINERTYDPGRHHVLSPTSCGVNALAPMARVLADTFGGISHVSAVLIMAQKSWQQVHDAVARTASADVLLRRACSQNIVPYRHPFGDQLEAVMPEIGPVLQSFWLAPAPVGSVAVLQGVAREPITVSAVNEAMAAAATAGSLSKVLACAEWPVVTTDVVGRPVSCLFDPLGTEVTSDGRFSVTGLFDNEWGFAQRLIDLSLLVSEAAGEDS